MSGRLVFKLVEKYHSEPRTRDLLPWTELPLTDQFLGKNRVKISVQCRGAAITISVQDTPIVKFEDDEFKNGLVGMILLGEGRAAFSDLLAEEACATGVDLPLSHVPGQH